MPVVRIMIVGVIAVVTVGCVIYDNREKVAEIAHQSRDHVVEIANQSRQQFAVLLRRLADGLSPDEQRQRQREEPMAMSGRSFATGADERPSTSAPQGELRRRGGGFGADDEKVSSSVVFEAPAMLSEKQPSESGYDTAPPAPPSMQSRPVLTPSVSSRTASDAGAATPLQSPPAAAPHAASAATEPFWSIHEWQENTTAHAEDDAPSSPSLAGSALSDIASDFGSDGGSDGTVGSWTEVASEFSDDHQNHI